MKIDKKHHELLTERPCSEPVCVSIIEDEEWMRRNLARLIAESPGFRLVSCYATAEEALERIATERPDVVLLDINLPAMDGVECLRRIRMLLPDVRCLMLTVFEESDKIFNSLLAGASGYLLKRTSSADLLEAMRQVREGGSPMSSTIARKVVEYFNQMGEHTTDAAGLSPRERGVLELLARGAAYKEIADQLSLGLETIRMYVKHIYTKLHVHSRGEATAKYLRRSWPGPLF